MMEKGFAKDVADGCTLSVRVSSGTRKNAVTGVHADSLKITLTAPPVDRKNNDALIAALADALRLPRVHGYRSSAAQPAGAKYCASQARRG